MSARFEIDFEPGTVISPSIVPGLMRSCGNSAEIKKLSGSFK